MLGPVPVVHPRPLAASAVGLGAPHPAVIDLGTGPAGLFTRVRWHGWGAALSRAGATGTCTTHRGRSHTCTVTLTAENPGPCHGVTAYRTLVVSQGSQSRRYGICAH